MKTLVLTFLLLVTGVIVIAQKELPVRALRSNDISKPLILYITGDGGFNSFSTAFMNELNKSGYAVVALDAKTYFWKKKKAEEAASDVERLMNNYLRAWNHKNFFVIGYSFGADVAPFILSRLSAELYNRCTHLVLMSPSPTTDFEAKVVNMMGFGLQGKERVPPEINKLNKPILFLFGKEEKDFPLQQITAPNKQVVILEGGHRYDGNAGTISNHILTRIH
ncbi:MAG: hypothetical protein ICV51_15915 [Flavisolibacter sp.]|nr:hypothetical protein [Flavisolibacter sp.]